MAQNLAQSPQLSFVGGLIHSFFPWFVLLIIIVDHSKQWFNYHRSICISITASTIFGSYEKILGLNVLKIEHLFYRGYFSNEIKLGHSDGKYILKGSPITEKISKD